jgi:hypothetical protein
MNNTKQPFKRHFRIYFRNGHPAYIVDEEGNKYIFHRVTHSKTSGGKKNWKKKNPLKTGGDRPMYIVKKEERDKKSSFSPFKLETQIDVDITYPEIKKAGRSQTSHDNVKVVNNNCPGKVIKTKKSEKIK